MLVVSVWMNMCVWRFNREPCIEGYRSAGVSPFSHAANKNYIYMIFVSFGGSICNEKGKTQRQKSGGRSRKEGRVSLQKPTVKKNCSCSNPY